MTEVRHGGGKGVGLNRECANCTPPCQGGEVLHRRGHCAHSYCLCMGFEPVKGASLIGALTRGVHTKLNGRGPGA